MAVKSVKSSPQSTSPNVEFVFDRINYILVILGLLTIVSGFILMAGGGTTDPNVFPAEEIYSFRRTILAPIIILLGFGIEIYAIFKR
jgi:hypothetical protein